jgi:Tol biopolymer transport system component
LKTSIKFSLLGVLMMALISVSGLTQVPGTGGRIVFVSDRDGSPNLYIMDLERPEIRKITEFPGEIGITYIIYPYWSADGKRILFTANRPEHWYQAYVINEDGTGLRQVTDYSLYAYYNKWDPTDNTYCYALSTNSYSWTDETFHKINLATLEETLIPMSPDFYEFHTSGNDGFDISPDGKEILFSRNHSYQHSHIGYQDMFGHLLSMVADDLPRTIIGDINPIDSWIAFHQSYGFPAWPPINVWKMDKSGQIMVPLTFGVGAERNEDSCWAGGDNGGYVIFSSNRFGNNEIVAMKADGNLYPDGMINLTNNPSSDSYPDWTPIGSYVLNFEGFFPPVENPPIVNKANAGQTIPINWRITDKNGLPVSDQSSFVSITSYPVSCETFSGDPTNEVQEFVAGSSGLQYQGDGWWQFNWKTPKTYKGQCRVMKLTLDDKSEHTASFSFK